ncbi:hypothetical protein [Aquabacterium humicola]|uniref:hypothetical protein n=1 Tax=Aquabacterium humicola TaxID=3237377 RepID=UPI002542F6F0|nr:hypothetical protein [Rubrivivax pictus]
MRWVDTVHAASVVLAKLPAQGVWAGVTGRGPRPVDLGRFLTPYDIESRVFPHFMAVMAPSQLSLYGVPIGVFRSNCVWVHAGLAQRLGARPESIVEWIDWLDRASALVPHPLGLGREPWQVCLLFEALVLGLCGVDFHRQAFGMGVAEALSAPCMRQALVVLGSLRRFVADDCVNHSWHVLARDVQAGRCAAVVMGDWLRNEFDGDPPKSESTAAKWLMPGTENCYLYNVDYLTPIVVPGQTLDRGGLAMVARALLDADVQGQFGRAKGALPAVRDATGLPVDIEGWRLLHLSSLNPDLLVPSMTFEQATPRGMRDAIAMAVKRFFFHRAGLADTLEAIARAGSLAH